ncbi:MAG: hypothetical protein ACK5MT_15075 [Actinomycetales bacterium]
MRAGSKGRLTWQVVALAVTLPLTTMAAVGGASAASTTPDPGDAAGVPAVELPATPESAALNDVREADPRVLNRLGRDDVKVTDRAELRRAQSPATAAEATLGSVLPWLGYDEFGGGFSTKDFTLRSAGEHIQVWVANDLAFPAGDCRNDLGMTTVTDAQVAAFVHEFDTNIYPVESQAFSVPPNRDGADAELATILGLPADTYQVDASGADDIVVLVDNVRDAQFYAPNSPDGQTYIAGFFSSTITDLTNRNVMTIDAFDWEHRTGAAPPDDSGQPAVQACAQALGMAAGTLGGPRARLYEGTFAHEYQHLLLNDVDPDESTWLNEGMSDYAQSLVGYVDTRIGPWRSTADSHLACFDGFLGDSFGGPENSLTLWGDQGPTEILCDYGAAFSFVEYLHSQYGPKLITQLHREPGNGLAGLDAILQRKGANRSAMQLVRDWTATAALDAVLQREATMVGGYRAVYSARTLTSAVNWSTPQAYSSPGAPPNGADYVRLRDAQGRWMSTSRVKSLSFAGSASMPSAPVEWQVDSAPATQPGACGDTPDGTGPAALYSGCGSGFDRAIARTVSVPASNPILSFESMWSIESEYDLGAVQVSADGGQTWTSVPTEGSVTELADDAEARIVGALPGLSGSSGGWVSQHADLSAYAGQDVLVSFRYLTDGLFDEAGWWVRDVRIGERIATDTLDGWQTPSQIRPTPVAGWTVQLVSIDRDTRTGAIHRLALDENFDGTISGARVRQALGEDTALVGAIVIQDDPNETSTAYTRYELRVNGVLQPGG